MTRAILLMRLRDCGNVVTEAILAWRGMLRSGSGCWILSSAKRLPSSVQEVQLWKDSLTTRGVKHLDKGMHI
ncbi:MAG: hypothetical protein JWN74_2521 [Acidobacteriaceae bacterium]|nr:hypothetical protein [Acidobacteriaceae bacterium]